MQLASDPTGESLSMRDFAFAIMDVVDEAMQLGRDAQRSGV